MSMSREQGTGKQGGESHLNSLIWFVCASVGKGHPGGAGRAGHGKQDFLHLRGKRAALRFFLRKTDHPINQGAKETGYDELFQSSVFDGRALARLHDRDRHVDQGIEAETRSDLQLAVAPANRQQLTARSKEQEEKNSENRYRVLDVRENEGLRGCVRNPLNGRKWPDGRARYQDECSDDKRCEAGKRGAQRPEHGPAQFNQDAELQSGTDDRFPKVKLKVNMRIARDDDRNEIAQDIPNAERTKDGKSSPNVPIGQQSYDDRFDADVRKPECIIQVQSLRPVRTCSRNIPSLPANSQSGQMFQGKVLKLNTPHKSVGYLR